LHARARQTGEDQHKTLAKCRIAAIESREAGYPDDIGSTAEMRRSPMTANSDQQAPHGEAPLAPETGPGPVTPDPVAPSAPGAEQPPQPPASPYAGPQPVPATVRHTRLGGLWLVFSLGAVILVLLLVFILMNGQRVQIHLYGGHWNVPLGVALLMAAALGILLVLVPGGGRILQLKRAARKLHKERESLASQLDQATTDVPTAAAPTGTPPTTPAG
jgi:uncharacterized integral membrane protein